MTIAEAARIAGEVFHLPSRVILGRDRDRATCLARGALAWAMRRLGPAEIGRGLGRKTWTMSRIIRHAEQLRATDPAFASRCAELEKRISI